MYAPSPPLQMSGITVHYSRFTEDGDGLSAADKIRIAVDSSPHGAISKESACLHIVYVDAVSCLHIVYVDATACLHIVQVICYLVIT